MSKCKIVMIQSEMCDHCVDAKPEVRRFHANNARMVDVEYIDYDRYMKGPKKYGDVEGIPHFVFIHPNGRRATFDIIETVDGEPRRTYNKLRSEVMRLYVALEK